MATPKWQDFYKTFQAGHQAQFGQDMNRAWTADADAGAAKKSIDDQYLQALANYNATNGTNELPDASVLGVNAQPNTFTPTDHSNDGFFGGVAKSLGMSTNDFVALAALAAGGYGLYSSGLLGGGAAGAASGGGATAGGGALGAAADFGAGTYAAGGGAVGAGTGAGMTLAEQMASYGAGGGGVTGGLATGTVGGFTGAAGGDLLGNAALKATNTGDWLKDNKSLVQLGGGLLGALAGKDTTTSASKDPWGPAQPYLKDNLAQNAAMQEHYRLNPFSNEQKAAYQGLLDTNANNQANAPIMQANANNFMQSKRGSMPAMQGLLSGTKAAPIDWAKYVIGKA